MPEYMANGAQVSRDFTVAVFVISANRVLLHFHLKLQRWLPPGGHIESDELPDQAALREVQEETGVVAILWGQPRIMINAPDQPLQLCPPAGIQVEDISPGHQHIDLVYFAVAADQEPQFGAGWFAPEEWQSLELTVEVEAWCTAAIEAIAV